MFDNILMGFSYALQPLNMLMIFLAVTLGFFGGAMPGISGVMMIIILIPVTYGMDPIPAFLLLTCIYLASSFSGAVSAILYRIPGTPEAVATSFDGYPMAQKGKLGQAMGVAMTSSAIGGIIGALLLMFLTPPLARFALRFSSPEYFALAIMGLTVVASLSAKNLSKGLIGALFGLIITTIGIDSISGMERFTFDVSGLTLGLQLVPVMIGLFGLPEVLKKCSGSLKDLQYKKDVKASKIKTKYLDKGIMKRIAPTIARSSVIGAIIGMLPGVGGTTAALLSYSEAVRWSKKPEEYGTGISEGIAAPETANNCAGATAFIPLFALGIPGSGTTAVLLGIFILHGLQPGPMFLNSQPEIAYTIFAGLFLINIVMLIFAKSYINLFKYTEKVPYCVFAPIIIIFCFVGTYAVRNSMFDVWVMVFFGILGYLLDKINFGLSPVILGIVLGPMAESELRRALIMSNGSLSIFVTRPLSLILLITAVLSIVFAIRKNTKGKKIITNDVV